MEVVLVGHSVGAYIVLEMIHRHRRRRCRSAGFTVRGAVLLTPTVSHIAQSPSGRVLATLLRVVPVLPVLGAAAAKALVAVLPGRWLRGLVGWVAGMDAGGGMGPLDATVAFLGSDGGVRQALEMAGEEMRVIGEERWGEEVWGAAAAGAETDTETDGEAERGAGATDVDEVARAVAEGGGQENVREGGRRQRTRPPKLVFYFAKTDHWVADHTRDELQRLRGRGDGKGEEWKPEMVVDEEDGLVHGWCIRQSGLVAGKVAKWIEDILSGR